MSEISKEQLSNLFSRSLNTVDGLWFLGVEEKYGLEAAVEIDEQVWERFMSIHVKRVTKTYGLETRGIEGLIEAIEVDPLWTTMKPSIQRLSNDSIIFRFTDCPSQRARVRDGRGEFPCKGVETACFNSMMKVFLPEGKLTCVFCPPDPHPEDVWCEWKIES